LRNVWNEMIIPILTRTWKFLQRCEI
jgi:hypothetical protein